MLQGWWWRSWVTDVMTGGGRCQKRWKSMAGGRGAAEAKKIDTKINIPNLKVEITEKSSGSPKISKLPLTSTVEFDLYTQARKALSFRSPFDCEDSQGTPAYVSSSNTLPSSVSQLLSRHSDSKKRHKKIHSGSEKKSSAQGKQRKNNFWVEAEEYFRELNVQDIDRLELISNIGYSGNEKCFVIPSSSDDNLCDRYDALNRVLANAACSRDFVNLDRGVELSNNGTPDFNGAMVHGEDVPHPMEVDGEDGLEREEFEIAEESNVENRTSSGNESTSISGVEWVLGSRSKVYLTTERPSKKRKILGRDAGFERLLVSHPVEGSESCHYCSNGNNGDPLNCLIKCKSCGMVIHQRCYGIQEDVDSSWLCSWCKWKNVRGCSDEAACLLCPKQGGALKPIRRSGCGSDNEASKVQFAHLFCCQWMPELYVENTRTMEPIMNMDGLKDTRKKLICYLCKVKCGACVRCSNGSCRTSFHPICAREARHRMEIWGKLGSDEVELRAFCSKHSELQYGTNSQDNGDTSLTAEQDLSKLSDDALVGEELLECKPNSNGDAILSNAKCLVDVDSSDVKACTTLKLSMLLKKLIELGKVNTKDLASDIGISPDSLDTILTDNNMVPELRCKLLRWLKTHVFGNLKKALKAKVRSFLTPKSTTNVTEGVDAVSMEELNASGAVPVKSVPPHQRTKICMRSVKDDKSEESLGEDSSYPFGELLTDETMKILTDAGRQYDHSSNTSLKFEDELAALVQCLSEDGGVGESEKSRQMTANSSDLIDGEVKHSSYIHPFIYRKLMQTKFDALEKSAPYQSAVLRDQEASQLEASSSLGFCCSNNLQAVSGERTSRRNGMNLDQLVKAKNLGMLKLYPADEVEGELIYYQQRLLTNAVTRKCTSEKLISKVVRSLPQEADYAGRQKWDAVLVNQYNHELREAKKQGRKERRHKEAQAVLAAATAAAAASSRNSSIRKDILEESSHQEGSLRVDAYYSQLNPRVKDTVSRLSVAGSSFDNNSDSVQLASVFSNDHPRTCDICRRSETVLNPILVCSSCKVAVHLDCYCSVTSTTGPWYCQLCEELSSAQGSGAVGANSWEKPYFVAECGLCGGTAGALRKSVDGQWIHALCAEWVLESTYRRGQLNPIEGMENIGKGIETCAVCRRKQGACLKCSYGHCQTMFHPTCARSSGFYMTTRTNGGKLQHKAYCEKHSIEQRAKAVTQKHGIEEFKSLKQVRVELERLRLLCERLVKREKLKRELVICSQEILVSSRDSVLSALARHPFYQPEVSSESATTSIKGYTDSDIVQRSDDMTVDSAVAGKRRVKLPMSVDTDQKTEDSSTSQNLYTLKPVGRPSFSGKHIPQRHIASRNNPDDMEKQPKNRKHSESFEKELIMTSDQASMKNQRLPKGFVYVPIRCLSKDKEAVADACSQEPVERNG